MTEQPSAHDDLQSVLETVADPDCRAILAELDEARSASEITERCDLPQTSVYRKLEALSGSDLIREQTKMRADGHHVTLYERDITGLLVILNEDDEFAYEFVEESTSPDQRLATFWSRISEEV